MLALFSVLLVVVASQPTGGSWDFNKCTFTTGTKVWDLSSLVQATGYYFTSSIYAQGTPGGTGDNANLINGVPNTPETAYFEFNICRPVRSQHAACNSTTSAVNMVSADKKTCTSLGDSRVGAIDQVPYKNGVMVQYRHGDWISHIDSYQTYVYLICNPKAEAPYFEHLKSGTYTWHLRMNTPVVC